MGRSQRKLVIFENCFFAQTKSSGLLAGAQWENNGEKQENMP